MGFGVTVLGLAVASMLGGCALDRAGLGGGGGGETGIDAAGADGGQTDARTLICDPARCGDGVACTVDRCGESGCENVPDDAACTAAPGGSCDASLGCQYPLCDSSTCTPDDGCSTARCEGDTCMRSSSCTAGQQCCAGACVTLGCDDGNPCTDDACGAAGCEHLDNRAPCDDGIHCNGNDVCASGACVSSGDPCSPGGLCDEASDRCVECLADGDCLVPAPGPWSACGGFSDTCDDSGTQSRTVTAMRCAVGACVPSTMMETRSCSRPTDGMACGARVCGSWGSCGYSTVCDETGTRTRSCDDFTCMGGSCVPTTMDESGACTRSTDGDDCALDGNACTADYCFGGRCVHPCRSNCNCNPSGCVCWGSG